MTPVEAHMAGLVIAIIVGACFGSFITMASYRLPRDMGTVRKPSFCPACNTLLSVKDLFPVMSWIMQKGKCRYCGTFIGSRYVLIELITAAIFAFLYLIYGVTFLSVMLALFAVGLLVMIVADLEAGILPDPVQWFIAVLGVVYNAVLGMDFLYMLFGALAGLGLGLSLHYGYKWIRKRDGLGLGDVKFLGVAGVWLGAFNLIPFIFYAGVLGIFTGLLWKKWEGGRFPFGPALALSLYICVVFPSIPQYFWSVGGLVEPR